MIIYNAEIVPVTSPGIKNGFVEFEGGRITSFGEMKKIPHSPKKEDIDAEGLTVYPAFIDAHCHIGMFGDGLGIEGDDGNEETDPVTPQLRAADAVNTMDACFSEAVAGGVGTVVTGPGSANAIGGTFLAMKTAGGMRIESRTVKDPCSMKFALGENPKNVYRDRDETPVTRMATAALIREQLFKAKRYMEDLAEYERTKDTDNETSRPDFDIKCEALIPVLKREIKAHFHCHRADDIFTAVRISEEFGLDYVLIHATEGYIACGELPKGTQCVAGPLLGDRCKPELARSDIKNPAVMTENGIITAICTDHPENPIQYLPVMAGLAIRGGIPERKALEAITINPARICGIDGRVGSIEAGKDADFALFSGKFFDITKAPEIVVLGGEILIDKREK